LGAGRSTTVGLVTVAGLLLVAVFYVVHRQMAGNQFIHKSGAILRIEGRDVTEEDRPLLER
jgi:hypothetical protein